ncbi:MAG: rRNA pseudouridine synthase [Treponemataceae bacterium]|nr:rRNA pseudouridine synthase [Treponemataceae bacterium]
MDRIDKVLSKQGLGSRKDVKKLLRSGVVLVNGEVCVNADHHVDVDTDIIEVSGRKISVKKDLYLMMNKRMDTVCAAKDGLHDTVFDCLGDEYRHSFLGGDLHLVGRLDIDTEGLLLFTTDGSLTHRLTSPKTHISKTYLVTLKDPVSEVEQTAYSDALRTGLEIPPEGDEGGFLSLPAELEWLSDTLCSLVIYEGKYHQVKRMFAALGNKVTALRRTAMGKLGLDQSLLPGAYRELTEDELGLL